METNLNRGDLLPHFEARTIQGHDFIYSGIWQRKQLAMILVPESFSDSGFVSRWESLRADFEARETVLTISTEPVPGLPAPGVVVADRWGEIVFVAGSERVDELPGPAELLDWADYTRRRCAECEGEWK